MSSWRIILQRVIFTKNQPTKAMILPAKHISLAESLFGLGAYLLRFLDTPKTVDELWSAYLTVNDTDEFPAYHSFDNVILALDFLYLIGSVGVNSQGLLQCAWHD